MLHTLTLLVLSLTLGMVFTNETQAAFAKAKRSRPENVAVLQSWNGKLAENTLRDQAPATGFVLEAATWSKLWQAWHKGEEIPVVDFSNQLVLVFTADGPNSVGCVPTHDGQGNVRAEAMATLMGGPGFGYLLQCVSREGVKTINGKFLTGADRSPAQPSRRKPPQQLEGSAPGEPGPSLENATVSSPAQPAVRGETVVSSVPSPTSPQWILPAIRAPRVQRHIFDSTAVKTKISYFIYTPEVYDTAQEKRFPVLYWLHGSGGGSAGVPQLAAHFDSAIRAGKIPPMLVVFPNGLPMGMWCDWKDGSVPMETIVIKELIPHIDTTFRTLAARKGRIIEGFSMGGYGAARLGFKHHTVFTAVSLLGAGPLQLDFTEAPRAGPRGRDEVLNSVFGGDLEQFKVQSPWRIAEQNAAAVRDHTLVRQVIGDRDETLRFNRVFHEHLTELKIPHSFTVLPGIPHNPMAVLTAMGELNWDFYRQALGSSPANARSSKSVTPPEGTLSSTPKIENFQLTGDRWTCLADGQPLSGLLLKPAGSGPFPAIVLSHGLGGNALEMMSVKGREMVQWGLLCIATDYSHAGKGGGGPAAARGRFTGVDFSQAGARPENIRRALACVEILSQMKDVDQRRIAAYGHSMGAFVTIALAAAASDKITAAAITAGGVITEKYRASAAPTADVAAQIRVPFLILHGMADTTVLPESSEVLKQMLDKNTVPNERRMFEGVGHNLPNQNNSAEVYRLMRDWFTKHGLLSPRERKGAR
jgi:dienelactone hydrolase